MTKALTPDLCVIGGGVAGYALAAGAAASGLTVVMIEKAKGDGTGREDLALHAFAAAAAQAHAFRHASRFGVADSDPDIDYPALRRRVRASVEATAPNRRMERLVAMGVLVLNEAGRFKDRRTALAGEHEIRARHFVVATGSVVQAPSISGIDSVDWLDYAGVLDLPRRPGRLVILGAEPACFQLAQAFRRLGSQVTIVLGGAALEHEDPELSAILLRQLRIEGVEIREDTRIERVERRGKTGIKVFTADAAGQEEALDGTHLMLAPERLTAVEDPGLDNARISFSKAGIKVDAGHRSSNRRVFAIGDVAGQWPSASAATRQAQLVLHQILTGKKVDAGPIAAPRLVLADPELAHIGLTEAQARKGNARMRVLRWPYEENERAQAEGRTKGFLKLVADHDERILGVSIVGPNAGEMIGVWSLALAQGLTVRDMAGYVPAHPTMGEIGKSASMAYFSGTTRKKGVRGLLRLLRLSS